MRLFIRRLNLCDQSVRYLLVGMGTYQSVQYVLVGKGTYQAGYLLVSTRYLLVCRIPVCLYAAPISQYGTYQSVGYLFVCTRHLLVSTVPISWYGTYQLVRRTYQLVWYLLVGTWYLLVGTVPIIRYGTYQSARYLFFGTVPKMNRSFQRLFYDQTFVSLNAQPAAFPVDGYTFHTKYLMRKIKMDDLSRSIAKSQKKFYPLM